MLQSTQQSVSWRSSEVSTCFVKCHAAVRIFRDECPRANADNQAAGLTAIAGLSLANDTVIGQWQPRHGCETIASTATPPAGHSEWSLSEQQEQEGERCLHTKLLRLTDK